MGKVIGSCGHELKEGDGPRGLGWLVTYEEHDREGELCEVTASVCTACKGLYEQQKMERECE